ncbi:MAG: hypothetical protein ACXVAO_06325 [Vulcanimicrobiaceae bacterium]
MAPTITEFGTFVERPGLLAPTMAMVVPVLSKTGGLTNDLSVETCLGATGWVSERIS